MPDSLLVTVITLVGITCKTPVYLIFSLAFFSLYNALLVCVFTSCLHRVNTWVVHNKGMREIEPQAEMPGDVNRPAGV